MGVLSWAFLNQPSDSIVLFALLISIPLLVLLFGTDCNSSRLACRSLVAPHRTR